ncbi:hypothetical protein HMPREF9444_00313 [Succinatimonas hippei YIT 12066]|uniref:Uncharacterized protein n=1 Tax=Succinatimonas hippei (strain DSM 22608 / JCM 16073 / KCTC 15190 / YIT 12066) TaxID=762983 RepID=E8LHZ9_SUCHY|nr:hypothetical protein HMPREF9444_00313 [Succinatimonas hippei YIT 12066]
MTTKNLKNLKNKINSGYLKIFVKYQYNKQSHMLIKIKWI